MIKTFHYRERSRKEDNFIQIIYFYNTQNHIQNKYKVYVHVYKLEVHEIKNYKGTFDLILFRVVII